MWPSRPTLELVVCNKLNSHQLNELIIIIISSFSHRSWIISSYYVMNPRRCRVLKLMNLFALKYLVPLVPHSLVIRIPYIWYGQGVRPIWNPYESCSLSESRGELLLSLSDLPWPRISWSTTSRNTDSHDTERGWSYLDTQLPSYTQLPNPIIVYKELRLSRFTTQHQRMKIMHKISLVSQVKRPVTQLRL